MMWIQFEVFHMRPLILVLHFCPTKFRVNRPLNNFSLLDQSLVTVLFPHSENIILDTFCFEAYDEHQGKFLERDCQTFKSEPVVVSQLRGYNK